MADETLLCLLKEVRTKTLSRLAGVNEQDARWTPSGIHNHLLWHAGHCYVVVEWLTARAVGRPPEIPASWFELFSWESDPAKTPPASWPLLATVLRALEDQQDRLAQWISEAESSLWGQPAAESPQHTRRRQVVHGLHDEACHAGEIWLLRKQLDLRHTTPCDS